MSPLDETADDYLSKRRKPHTKSRHGCIDCRRRRVKVRFSSVDFIFRACYVVESSASQVPSELTSFISVAKKNHVVAPVFDVV